MKPDPLQKAANISTIVTGLPCLIVTGIFLFAIIAFIIWLFVLPFIKGFSSGSA
jgi:ABC-type transporter Mla subunit MlaD